MTDKSSKRPAPSDMPDGVIITSDAEIHRKCALISLGTNMGHLEKNLDDALSKLSAHPAVEIIQAGRRLKNKAIIIEDQPDFLNQIAQISTSLDPLSLLKVCLSTEEKLGRVRSLRYGPRIIDLDILIYCEILTNSQIPAYPGNPAYNEIPVYNEIILNSDELTLPHPGLADREYLKILMEDFQPVTVRTRRSETALKISD